MQQSLFPVVSVLLIYCLVILVISYVAKTYMSKNADFLLAGRNLSGKVTALGAGASDMSSWLLMVLPGIVFTSGLSMSWMPIALLLGAYLNWVLVSKRLRIYTEVANDSMTLPAYFYNRFAKGGDSLGLRTVTALATIIFFLFYSVAGFISGAILLQLIFDISYLPALLICSVVIVTYTVIGGFLAVSWVDFFQGCLMLCALIIVPVVCATNLGGFTHVLNRIYELSPNHLNFFVDVKILGVISLIAWGIGYFGQPHIIVRFMAIRTHSELPIARRICTSWMFLSLVGAIATGLVGFLYFNERNLANPDTVFIVMSQEVFNPWLTGVLLSAVLSAVMSTAAAQILMTGSIITEDFCHGIINNKSLPFSNIWLNRFCVIIVSVVAVVIAAFSTQSLFAAIGFAWCGLGASFGPTIMMSLYWKRMTSWGAISGIGLGMSTVIAWELSVYFGIVNHPDILPGFAMIPGVLASIFGIVLVSILGEKPPLEVVNNFEKAKLVWSE